MPAVGKMRLHCESLHSGGTTLVLGFYLFHPIGLYQLVGGSTGPSYRRLCDIEWGNIQVAKIASHLSAIKCCINLLVAVLVLQYQYI